MEEGLCDAAGVVFVSIGDEAFDGDPVAGGPAVGLVPLEAGFGCAHGEAAGTFEEGEF